MEKARRKKRPFRGVGAENENMDDLTAQDSLEFEVANFGPIVKGKIHLRPLTVFVGPSNTGKSYLATLIYALQKYFSGGSQFSRFVLNYDALMAPSTRIVERETIDSIRRFLEHASIAAGKPGGEGNLVLTAPIVKAICSVFEVESDQLGNEIRRCFGIDNTGALIRRGTRDLRTDCISQAFFERFSDFRTRIDSQGADR